MDKEKDNTIESVEDIRIPHKNILWYIYRALAETIAINTTQVDKADKVRRE